MQTELLLDVVPPPSYEESVCFKQLIDQIKTQRRKTPPPSYNSKHIFEWTENKSRDDAKPIPALETTTTTENNQEPLHERLERVSSSLVQMIQAAEKSLTAETKDIPEKDTISLQQQCMNRKKSLERLRSSQTSLARTMDQLNVSITQHVIYTHHHHHYRTAVPKKNWTHLLGQTALVFSVCHHLFSWSKPTSSLATALWLLFFNKKLGFALLARFRQQ